MSVSAKVGTLTMNTSTGNQAFTGIGFQPKVVFLWSSLQSSDASAQDFRSSFGAASSSSARWASSKEAPWGFGNGYSKYNWQADRCLIASNGFGTLLELDFVSMDADGFTLNVVATNATAFKVHYLALGGTDLQAQVGSFNLTDTSATTTAVTGVGFQPDALIFGQAQVTATDGEGGYPNHMLGFAVGTSEKGCAWSSGGDGDNPHLAKNYLSTSYAVTLADVTNAGTALLNSCTVSALGADGFTVSLTNPTSASPKMGYVALKGGQYKIMDIAQKTSTGTQARTGVGFQPIALLAVSVNSASSANVQADGNFMIGGASSASARAVISNNDTNNVSTTSAHGSSNSGKFLQHITTTAGATATINAEADVSSIDGDGWTEDWTTADGTARRTLVLAFGDVVGAAPTDTDKFFMWF